MTTRYRVEYALKTHRRDQLIEWIKGLLAVPFVLNSQPTGTYNGTQLLKMGENARRRYLEIFRDVESLIDNHSGWIHIANIIFESRVQSTDCSKSLTTYRILCAPPN